ncbi:MAG: Ig domain-containing protein [Lachnospiraceae bacterium]|nr:Ig domain-containing protein [Lachnospiraceae bacterium]
MKQKKKQGNHKRGLSAFMAGVMTVTQLVSVSGLAAIGAQPMHAMAAGEEVMQLGFGSIADGDQVLYGKKPDFIKLNGYNNPLVGKAQYRVLDADCDNSGRKGEGEPGAMFLMSEELWGSGSYDGGIRFDASSRPGSPSRINEYQGSEAQAWCTAFLTTCFSEKEQAALRAITKSDGEDYLPGYSTGEEKMYQVPEYKILNGDKVFFLSLTETYEYVSSVPFSNELKAAYNGHYGGWWLRTAAQSLVSGLVSVVTYDASLRSTFVDEFAAARPAFNINRDSVIFSSDAEVVKSTSSTLEAVAVKSNVSEWKMTILDSEMSVTPGEVTSDTVNPRKTVLSDCTATGEPDRISVMITDRYYNIDGAKITYYGKLGDDKSFTLPAALDVSEMGKSYHVYLLPEKTDTGYASDYAGVPVEVTIADAPEVDVDGITLDQTTAYIAIGDAVTLAADVTPSTATYKTVEWISGDTGVATVDKNGVVTGVKAGTATITAYATNGTSVLTDDKKAECVVTVTANRGDVVSVTLNEKAVSLVAGATFKLTATVGPDTAVDKTVRWYSNSSTVASVDENGFVMAKEAGTATITVTATNGTAATSDDKAATCIVTVLADGDDALMQFGTGSIADGDKVRYGKKESGYQYYENTPGPLYIVLDADCDNSGASKGSGEAGAMFLVSDQCWGTGGHYGNVYYNTSQSTMYQGSVAQAWCEAFMTANLSAKEQVVLCGINKSDVGETLYDIEWGASDNILDGDKVFFLSAREVYDYISPTEGEGLRAAYNRSEGYWWLRSWKAPVNSLAVGVVKDVDLGYASPGMYTYGARPAFNVDLSSVIFSADSDYRKPIGSTPEAIASGAVTQWRLTLLDDSLSVKPGAVSIDTVNPKKIILASCKTTGDPERVSVMITDKAYGTDGAKITHYGKLDTDKSFILPDGLDVEDLGTGYHVYLLAENINTGYASDLASAPVEVKLPGKLVTDFTLSKTELEMDLETKIVCGLEVSDILPADASDKTLVWETSDTDVIQLLRVFETEYTVKAEKPGTATITVTATNGTEDTADDVVKTCTVTVAAAEAPKVDVSSVTLNKTTESLVEGKTTTLTATVAPTDATDKTVTWKSDDTSVATVDDSGKVTAVKAGTATITATATNGTDDTADDKTASCEVTVTEAEAPKVDVSKVTLDQSTVSLVEEETVTLIATVTPRDATDKTVTWSSDKTSVATVDADGKVTAVKAGTAIITVMATNGTDDTTDDKTASCEVTVTETEAPKTDITGITLNKTSVTLEEGKTESLTATVTPEDATDKTVTWTSSDTGIATVDEEGKITAVAVGNAVIIVTATNGTESAGDDKTTTCIVNVVAAGTPKTDVTGVTLTKTETNIREGEIENLKYTVAPDDASDKTVTWTSSDETVATVDADGKVTAVAAGTATITVTATNGTDDTADDKTATCEVTVTAATEPKTDITGVTLDKAELTVEEGKTETLAATVTPEDASSKDVIWSSSDDTVASIDADGVVVAVKAGTATITVTATNGTEDTADDRTATCEVTVTEAETKTDITGITLDKTTVSLEVEQIETLTVTVEPEEATDKNVTFKSSDEKIATVDEEGKITAVAEGSTVIIVTADNGTAEAEDDKKATCIVTVTAKKTSPEIPEKGTALVKDDQGKLVYYKDGEPQKDYSGLANVDGTWYYVEKGVLSETKTGFVMYEDGLFLVVEGKLLTSKSGLVQDPYNPDIWYFLADGQVQSQYTGLALYDGEWFYVNKGRLDTTIAAYIEYDGGLFYVAAGRILKEVSGLAQDPNGPDWYFLAEGQAQTQYTGLALYDGEWFYVVEGKLAEDYTGTVEYDGSEFNVVSGMVK